MGFEDLEVWQQAHELAVEVYKLARQFPPDESFRYTDQICRASTSIPTNVAEGTGRYGKRDFKHFLYIARPVQSNIPRGEKDRLDRRRVSIYSSCTMPAPCNYEEPIISWGLPRAILFHGAAVLWKKRGIICF